MPSGPHLLSACLFTVLNRGQHHAIFGTERLDLSQRERVRESERERERESMDALMFLQYYGERNNNVHGMAHLDVVIQVRTGRDAECTCKRIVVVMSDVYRS